jgi:TonB family protein
LLGWILLSGLAGAQDGGKLPSVDESKLPDWVKRQAASPQKFIINSAGVRPKAEPSKPQPVSVPAAHQAERKLPPQTTEHTAKQPDVQAVPVADPASGRASPPGEVTTDIPPAIEPTPARPAAVVEVPMPTLVLLKKVVPVLSPELLDELVEASVTVSFSVGIQGEIIDPQISASGDQRLNRSVLRALHGWRYAPISEPRRHSVTFVFALNK